MIHYINEKQLLNEIINCSKIVLIEFVMLGSEPCEKQHEILREIEGEYKDAIEIFRINIDESQEIKINYHISSVPTLLILKDTKEIERISGLTDKETIINLINEVTFRS